MIVNPQLFNYRLIISSLIVAIAVLAVFSFSNYQSIESERQFIEGEKKLVESELSQMISSYDEVSLQSNNLSINLENAKQEAKTALDSLQLMKSDLSVISKYKKQLLGLKSKNNKLLANIDSLSNFSTLSKEQTTYATEALKLQLNENVKLIEINEVLNTTINKAAALKTLSVDASAYNSILGANVETNKAIKTNAIDVCFTLAENILTKPGSKEIYVQIVNPRSNVFADKGVARFGESSLIYSAKTVVNYQNENLEVCITIGANKKEQPLAKGAYLVNVFYKDKKLGSTEVLLK